MIVAPIRERCGTGISTEWDNFKAWARTASTPARTRYVTTLPKRPRTACWLKPGTKMSASDQVQSTVTISRTGTITAKRSSALRGPKKAKGRKAAAQQRPTSDQQGKYHE